MEAAGLVERVYFREDWLQESPQTVAQRLLGCVLVRQLGQVRCSGVIVEVEAYLGSQDPASHSWRGERPRNRSMFLAAGSLYVYAIHSRHCLNVVTEAEGTGSAVLIRAIEPLEGLQQMARLRQLEWPESQEDPRKIPALLRNLTSGPGRLCQSLGVDRRLDGVDLNTSSDIWLAPPPSLVFGRQWQMRVGPRIGISQAVQAPLRWFMDGHQLVSGRASAHTRGRHWRFCEAKWQAAPKQSPPPFY